jgi:fatty acid desaturase
LLWLYLIPVFIFFPPAFALNRLGQHYDIDPSNPAKWSTRMTRSRFWGFVYLWSHHHLEHHYFPGVPFYRLPDLNLALESFFSEEGIKARSYCGLLRDWLLRNRTPHTNWMEAPGDLRKPPPSPL